MLERLSTERFLLGELRESSDFIGLIDVSIACFEAHLTPCVEVGSDA